MLWTGRVGDGVTAGLAQGLTGEEGWGRGGRVGAGFTAECAKGSTGEQGSGAGCWGRGQQGAGLGGYAGRLDVKVKAAHVSGGRGAWEGGWIRGGWGGLLGSGAGERGRSSQSTPYAFGPLILAPHPLLLSAASQVECCGSASATYINSKLT